MHQTNRAAKIREEQEKNGKVCTQCEKRKPLDEFYKVRKGHWVRIPRCIECSKKRHSDWAKSEEGKAARKESQDRYSSSDKAKATKTAYRKKCMAEWKLILNKQDKLSCSICGYDKNFAALDYHHLDPSKKEATSNRIFTRPPNQKSLAELDKMVCLCANCHREEHFPTQQMTMEDFIEQSKGT